jgi:hypothetical protein
MLSLATRQRPAHQAAKRSNTRPSAATVTSHASPRQQTDKHSATEYMHATVRDQRCFEIAHTVLVLVAGTFSGFISGTKMSTQSVCNEQFYESVFGSSSSQRRLIIQVHLCILYDCINIIEQFDKWLSLHIYIWRHPTHSLDPVYVAKLRALKVR